MKSIWIGLIGLCLLIQKGNAQETVTGKVFVKFGDDLTGNIRLNFNGSNDDLIEISTSETTKSKNRKSKSTQTSTSTIKLNIGLIFHIVINDTTYYFRDIKVGYNDKYEKNVLVRLIGGTVNSGIFQKARSTGDTDIAVKLPGEELSKLVSTEFDYYTLTSGWHMLNYRKCKDLYSKMLDKLPGYGWNESTPKSERLSMWRKWIEEYNECQLVE